MLAISSAQVFMHDYNTTVLGHHDTITGSELINDNVSLSELNFNQPTGQTVISIGANPSTITWPDGHKAAAERMTDIIDHYQSLSRYQHELNISRLEPTRENVIRSLEEQGVKINTFTQINLFSQRTINNQILKAIIESESDSDINEMISITTNVINMYVNAVAPTINDVDLIFLGWGAALGDNILAKLRFEKYRERLYELLEPHFDKLMCMKLSETMQPYHPSSSAYRVVPLSTLIRRDQFAEMFHLN